MVSPSGGNSASSEVGLALGENSASPELGLDHLPPPPPANHVGRHSFDYSLHDCMPESRLDHGEKTSISPERGFSLDSIDKRTSSVTRSYIADVRIISAFCHTYHCFNNYD
jgi:hypothetical protein